MPRRYCTEQLAPNVRPGLPGTPSPILPSPCARCAGSALTLTSIRWYEPLPVRWQSWTFGPSTWRRDLTEVVAGVGVRDRSRSPGRRHRADVAVLPGDRDAGRRARHRFAGGQRRLRARHRTVGIVTSPRPRERHVAGVRHDVRPRDGAADGHGRSRRVVGILPVGGLLDAHGRAGQRPVGWQSAPKTFASSPGTGSPTLPSPCARCAGSASTLTSIE